jgi:hypothetical protein
VTADTLDRTEQQAAKIFGRAGIELHWVDCPVSREDTEKLRNCAEAEASGGHYLEILPQSMAARRSSVVPHRFGYAVPPHFAYVFAERVEGLARDQRLSLHVVLGFVIAHELGHLLLGADMHSRTGIMSEDLSLQAFRRAEEGILLVFSQEQAQRMQVRLREEMLAQK